MGGSGVSVQGTDSGSILIFSSGFSRDFDGPGNRLIFYLKGCGFSCDWCASPESISPRPEILFYPERGGGKESASCPRRAVSAAGLNREICAECRRHECVTVWHDPAFELSGVRLTHDEVIRKAEAAGDFISGITFGGGEPTLQSDSLLPLCIRLREMGFHVAMESNASTAGYRKFIGKLDLLYSDLKTLSPEIAGSRMGADISRVPENLRMAAAGQEEFILRIPVVSGVNTQEDGRMEIAGFCAGLAALRPAGKPLKIQLLRQHHLGEPKYAASGRMYKLSGAPLPEIGLLEKFAAELRRPGIEIQIFG